MRRALCCLQSVDQVSKCVNSIEAGGPEFVCELYLTVQWGISNILFSVNFLSQFS